MTVHAQHNGIQYELTELSSGEWQWCFKPPSGPRCTGRVRAEIFFAHTVARRSIDVWHLMNPSRHSEAA